jgi:putative transposase
MPDILALLLCLQSCVPNPTLRHLSRSITALLTMTGRVTMLGISRWAGKGGSYRTVQRFFATTIPRPHVLCLFFRHHLFSPDDLSILAGDEVVVTKAGKTTFGVDRFFSSIFQHSVPSLAFFSLALVSTKDRRAFPVRLDQVVRTEAEKAASQAKAAAKKTKQQAAKRPPGRPKGSTAQPKTDTPLSPELGRIQASLRDPLPLLTPWLSLTYLVLDGHFGTRAAVRMVQQCGLQLISKLRSDAALYQPYEGPQTGRGPRRKYGAKLDYAALPERYLKETTVEGAVETRIFQGELLHKDFGQALNVVIIEKVNRRTKKRGHVVLFSSDLTLGYEKLVENYSLRFQIEFTFRDAKHYWGLEDFMNVSETAVTNAATLSLLMVSVASVLLREARQREGQWSVLALKAQWRGSKYVLETLNLLPEAPEEKILAQMLGQVASLGCIHRSEAPLKAA